jgi:hypothetical protein
MNSSVQYSALCLCVPFGHPDDNIDVGLARRFTQAVGGGTGDFDGMLFDLP